MILKQLPEDFIVEEIPLLTPQEQGDYNYYKLKKRDYNTEDVIQKLSKKFNIPRKHFSYAGTKDRNAITTQYFTCKNHIPDIKETDYSVEYLGKTNKPLSLGDHLGNKFIITIRDIDELPQENTHFTNLFGDQRFSKHNLDIGISILKKDFQTAVSLVDRDEVQDHIINRPNDYVGALQKVPFKILKIYIHSVQSFFWNKVAEKVDAEEIPLISFDTEFKNKKIEEEYNMLLQKYKLSMRDFVIRQFHNLTPHGTMRKRIAEVNYLKIGNLEKDELKEGRKKVIVEFILPKGSYATVYIKSLYA